MTTMTVEEWRTIPGWSGYYSVSDQGRVKTTRRKGSAGGILAAAPAGTCRRYPYVQLKLNGARRTVAVHKLVAEAFLGPCPDGMAVRHLNGNGLDCRAANLAYGTWSQNILDRQAHGTEWQSARTHCPQGHPYDLENTYVYYRGEARRPNRTCRTCNANRRK